MLASGGEVVLAHGIGGRSDLPIPPWLAMYAGAVAVLVSFFALAALWTTPRLRGAEAGRPLPLLERLVDAAGTRIALRLLGVVSLAIFLFVGWLGPDDNGQANPAPTWFYVWFWVGLVPFSLLFGPIWQRLNPLRTLAGLLRSATRGRTVPLPAWIGYWPAVAGLVVFLWIELVYDGAASPRVVAAFVTGYAIIQIAAGVVFGQRWFERSDSFEVYSWMISRASPLGRRSDGRVVLRNPLDGLAGTSVRPDLTPVVLVVLGSTAFDGLSRTPLWSYLIEGTDRGAYLALGSVGLAGACGAVVLTYGLAIRLTRRYLDHVTDVQAVFAHSIIPIAIGYTVAHYFSFALFQGQQGILLANDPLVRGWDLLGLSETSVNYMLVSTVTIAIVQSAAIIVGHAVAVAASHDRAVATLPRQHARQGQYPMLVLMVLYTVTGIALLAGG